MIRYKILGASDFAMAPKPSLSFTNRDLGHFNIGYQSENLIELEDCKLPPQQLVARFAIHYAPCQPTVVIKNSTESAVWHDFTNRCSGVELHFTKILESTSIMDEFTNISTMVSLPFQQAPTIYLTREDGFHLWPCGGSVDKQGNPTAIEQVYGEPPPDLNLEAIYLTKASDWLQLDLTPGQRGYYLEKPVIFYPPYLKNFSLAQMITNGEVLFSLKNQEEVEFKYQSFDFTNPTNTTETLDISFTRRNI